ncbi:MAG: DUF5666 domain-containing protein [Firmicutes bacterium]|nr:DUF5666 domain-containing protein [Bacillota bacterium]
MISIQKNHRLAVTLILTVIALCSLFACRESETRDEETNSANVEKTANEIATDEASTYSTTVSTAAAEDSLSETEIIRDDGTMTICYAVYLGVKDYGALSASDKDSFIHRFSIDGEEVEIAIATGLSDEYAIQNTLKEGYVYDLTVENETVTSAAESAVMVQGVIDNISADSVTVGKTKVTTNENTRIYKITAQAGGAVVEAASVTEGKSVKIYGDFAASMIYLTFVSEDYESPVGYTAGERTLKNFLATAMQPVGTTLYIYGGAWNWQDTRAGNQATSIGLAKEWIEFFRIHDATFSYIDSGSYSATYYPFGGWNQYCYAGMDCSGYVGWTVYNTMNTVSGGNGYVTYSTKMARTLAETYGFGTWTHNVGDSDELTPGDIISISGHVWICLGLCDDSSVVILHSTPSVSKEGYAGGGVQLTGLGNSEDCDAVTLARYYMSKYYPEWSERYEAVYISYKSYTSSSDSSAGRFSWSLGENETLTDPDGYALKSAEEILKDLFE